MNVLFASLFTVLAFYSGYLAGRSGQRLRILRIVDARQAEARKILDASKSVTDPLSRLVEIAIADRMCDGTRAILDALEGKS